MKMIILKLFSLMCLFVGHCSAFDITEYYGDRPMDIERIAMDIIDYFAVQDPKGIPVLIVPEPVYHEDELKANIINFSNLTITGTSEIRLDYVNLNLTSLTAKAQVSCPELNLLGNYFWPGWWNSEGDANITSTGILLTLDVAIGVTDKGTLHADEVTLGVSYEKLLLDFTGLQGAHIVAVAVVDTFFSSFIKPMITDSLAGTIRGLLDSKFESLLKNQTFPDSISPVDYTVAKLRKKLRGKFDPFVIAKQKVDMAFGMTLLLTDITLTGASTIHRTHEIAAEFIDNAIFATLQVGTMALKGGADWSLSAALLPAVSGHIDLEVESLSITIEVKQPGNIRSPPVLRKIDIQLGNLEVLSSGEGTADYAIEAIVNVLPNMLRNVIMDKLEPKIHQAIQKNLNRLDLHRIAMDQLAKLSTKPEVDATSQ